MPPERHRERDPNPYLVQTAGELPPGRALDAGCGDGAEARWLARHGWTVTGADIAQAALDRARMSGAPDDSAITWQQADLLTWEPGRSYDLVCSHYVHVPGRFEQLLDRLASWVAPGGTLLVVGHDPADSHVPAQFRHAVHTVYQLGAALDPGEWEVATWSATHTVRQADQDVAFLDTVLRAVRQAAARSR